MILIYSELLLDIYWITALSIFFLKLEKIIYKTLMLVKRGKNSNRNETLKYFLTIFKIVCNENKLEICSRENRYYNQKKKKCMLKIKINPAIS